MPQAPCPITQPVLFFLLLPCVPLMLCTWLYSLSSFGAHPTGHFLPEAIHFPIMHFASVMHLLVLTLNRVESLLLLTLGLLRLSSEPHPPLPVGSFRARTVPMLLTTVVPNAWHIVGACDYLLKGPTVNLIRPGE